MLKFCFTILFVILGMIAIGIIISTVLNDRNISKTINESRKDKERQLAKVKKEKEKIIEFQKEEKEYKNAVKILSTSINDLVDSNEVKSSEFVSNKINTSEDYSYENIIMKYEKDYF